MKYFRCSRTWKLALPPGHRNCEKGESSKSGVRNRVAASVYIKTKLISSSFHFQLMFALHNVFGFSTNFTFATRVYKQEVGSHSQTCWLPSISLLRDAQNPLNRQQKHSHFTFHFFLRNTFLSRRKDILAYYNLSPALKTSR